MTTNTTPFKVFHLSGKIYLFVFDELYDLCMHFLRYQEFYESPKFNGKPFTIIEFIEWYSKSYGDGAFTYTKDWAGFNIPSNVIWQVHATGIADYNKYDAAMLKAFNQISSTTHLRKDGVRQDGFYILGACKNDIGVLGHELAHGLYATDAAYNAEMQECRKKMPPAMVKNIFAFFKSLGYNEKVFEDELQVYLATELPNELRFAKRYAANFKVVFAKYAGKIDFDLNGVKPLEF